jgi:thymidylate synthase (FAD)
MSSDELPTKRPLSTELESILGRKFPVLDDGFVRVVDYMGSDAAVVQAARISYGAGTKRVSEDRGLIRYLLRHRHTTPFEMCELKLHVRVPMDCWRQWIRHRTANVNEYSTRYSEAIDAAQATRPGEWRFQSTTNKQGSSNSVGDEIGALLTSRESELQQLSRQVYEERIAAGVAREQARKDLPLSTYTEAYWKIDLHNLLHFLALRMDAHAQLEIRSYANVIGQEIVRKWCPMTWEAFCDLRTGALSLTRIEAEILRYLLAGRKAEAVEVARAAGLLIGDGARPSRESIELEAKFANLGLALPWAE